MSTQSDYSAEILNTYYGKSGKVLCVEMKNGEILVGVFVGFFNGDRDAGESRVTAWRFVSKAELDSYRFSPAKYQEFGRIIKQADIKSVTFE